MRSLCLALAACLLAAGAAAQGDSCDGDAELLERAPTLHAMLADASWVDVILSSPVEETKEVIGYAAQFMGDYACFYQPGATFSPDEFYQLVFFRTTLVDMLAEPTGIWSAALDWENFAGTEGPAMRAAFAREVETLGFRPIYAEGGIAALSFGSMEVLERGDTPRDALLYLDMQEAVGRLLPFDLLIGDLHAEADVLGRSERIFRDSPSSVFAPEAQQHLKRALGLLASLHPIRDEDGVLAQGDDSWQVGAANASGLPLGGSRSALEYFIATYPNSRYAEPFANLLADPPLAISRGDLDVIIVGRSESDNGAEAQTLAFLDRGIDVSGPVKLASGEWGVAFRYFPAGDARLNSAEARARGLGLAPERVRVDATALNRIDWR